MTDEKQPYSPSRPIDQAALDKLTEKMKNKNIKWTQETFDNHKKELDGCTRGTGIPRLCYTIEVPKRQTCIIQSQRRQSTTIRERILEMESNIQQGIRMSRKKHFVEPSKGLQHKKPKTGQNNIAPTPAEYTNSIQMINTTKCAK